MSFLAPLFILGVLAVAAPIVFHLIRRTSREKIPFSSLMFLQPTPPRVTRKSRLENILLLILRCTVLCLLALAFGRPFFRRPLNAEPAGGNITRTVLLVDSSASMRRESLWTEARARAIDFAREARPFDEVAIFNFDRNAHSLVSFEDWGKASPGERGVVAGQRLGALEPAWSSTHLGDALLAATEALDSEHNSAAAKRRIVVISDFQDGAHLEGLQGFSWPKNVQVSLVTVKVKHRTNAGLQSVARADETAQIADALRVRVSNASESTREEFELRWAGDVSSSNTVTVYVPPGQSRTVEAPKSAASGHLILSGDEAEFDNSLYVVPPHRDQIEIVFVGGDGETDPQQLLFYLRRAFADTFRQEVRVQSVLPGQLSSVRKDGNIFVVGAPLDSAEAAELTRRIRDGATALVVLRTAGEAATLAALAEQAVTAEEAPPSGYAMFAEIDFAHPLFAAFADARFSDFTKIHFWKHRQLKLDPANGRALAKFDDGSPAIAQFSVGKGNIFAFASGWQPADSQFALSSKFVPLLYSFLELGGTIKPQAFSISVGDPVNLSGLRATNALTVTKPDGKQITLAVEAKAFVQTDLPGVYNVTGIEPPFRFGVNLAPDESKTTPMAVERLEQLGVPIQARPAESPQRLAEKEAQRRNSELESHQKLWRWLIVATLVVLIVETWVATRLSRRGAVQAESPA